MSERMSEYLDYVSLSEHNFRTSLLNVPEAISFFVTLDEQLGQMSKHLDALPDITVRDSFYCVGTFLLIARRQLRNAFSLFLRRMSYDGLLLFRVALESTVFAYRIFKNPALIEVWARKNQNPKEFAKHFRRGEFPDDMPYRAEIRSELNLLNEYWAHPNINYFSTTAKINEKAIQVHSFDGSDEVFHLVLLSFLDLCVKIVTIFRKTMQDRFKVFVASTESDHSELQRQLELLKGRYRAKCGIAE